MEVIFVSVSVSVSVLVSVFVVSDVDTEYSSELVEDVTGGDAGPEGVEVIFVSVSVVWASDVDCGDAG